MFATAMEMKLDHEGPCPSEALTRGNGDSVIYLGLDATPSECEVPPFLVASSHSPHAADDHPWLMLWLHFLHLSEMRLSEWNCGKFLSRSKI